jgi:hypothetical protein
LEPPKEKILSTTTKWCIIGSSAIGTSHKKTGAPCQDAFTYKLLSSGELIIAVSDGAGSASKSDVGSAKTVETAVAFLVSQLADKIPTDETGWEVVIKKVFHVARDAIVELAEATEAPLRDYAATLALVVLTNNWVAGGLVGDSITVILDEDEQLSVLCIPQRGEYANMTNFLTQDNALDVLDIQIKNRPSVGAAVFSDGLQSLAVNIAHNTPHAPFFTPLFAFTTAIENETIARQQLTDFLNSERVNARTDDDKTLVLARRER